MGLEELRARQSFLSLKDSIGSVADLLVKGQLVSKADWRAIDSPKKRMDEFACLLFYSSRQTNQIRPYVFWENLRQANLLFEIN